MSAHHHFVMTPMIHRRRAAMNEELESIVREHLVEANLALLFAIVLKSFAPADRQQIIEENKRRMFDQPVEGMDPALAALIPDAWHRVNVGFWEKVENASNATAP
jgi:hypothetical protein